MKFQTSVKLTFSLLTIVLTLNGCVSTYKFEEYKPLNSRATFIMSEQLREQSSNQKYGVYIDEYCEEKDKFGESANMTYLFGASSESAYLPTNKPVYIFAKSFIHSYSDTKTCSNLYSFLPQNNSNYSITQITNWPSCEIKIFETTNNKIVSAQKHDVAANCEKQYKVY